MKLSIAYQQLTTPPPFAYGYSLDIEDTGDGLKIAFELEYLNRDTLSQDEIEEEGFTSEDDFEWSGELGTVWKSVLEDGLSGIELMENSFDENTWLHIRYEHAESSFQGHPTNQSDWEYLLQELMQAIFEKSGQEMPLSIGFVAVDEKAKVGYQLLGSFEKRTATLGGKSMAWDQLKELMELVYSGDFQGKGSKTPVKNGLWVDLTGEGFYQKFESTQSKKDTLTHLLVKLAG